MTQEEFFKRYTYSPSRDRIGGGSFGTVYKAYDNLLHRELAIKVSEVKTTADGKKTFSLKDEFEALSHVPKHPNIANYEELYSFEMPNGIFDYAVMQYYPDGNLSNAIKQGLTAEQKEDIALQLLEGIGFLHKHKVVHRDLKPSNILIVKHEGRIIPLITDFGLSKAAGVVDGSVFSNSFGGGTPRYSSPEQLQGKDLRLNTDLWSYGAILYELFTGQQLFSAGSGAANTAQADLEIYNKIVNGDVRSLRGMPETWRKVAERCLVVDPTKRAKDATELFAIVEDDEDETELTEGPSGPGRPSSSESGAGGSPKPPASSSNGGVSTGSTTAKPKNKNKKALWIGLGIAAAVIVALLLLLKPKQEPTSIDPDTEEYLACQTLSDYRAYCENYGKNAAHYAEALHKIDSLDSIQRSVTGDFNGHNYVDLGLPSGTLWKNYNEDGLFKYDDAMDRFGMELPNIEQLEELKNQCRWTWIQNGYKVVGPNGDSIVLPASGWIRCEGDGDGGIDDEGSFGGYWASTIYNQSCAYGLNFTSRYVHLISNRAKCMNYSVRLVMYDSVAQSQAKESLAQAEAEKDEVAAYKKCTTIDACEAYLKAYPDGRYVEEVKAKLQKLKQEQKEKPVESTPLLPLPISNGRPDLIYYFRREESSIDRKNSKSQDALLKEALNTYNVKGFRIYGWASPDEQDYAMPDNYAQSVEDHIKSIIKQSGKNVNSYSFETKAFGPDLMTLIESIQNSDISNRDDIVMKIHNSSDKKKTIREMLVLYPKLEELMSTTRRAEVFLY